MPAINVTGDLTDPTGSLTAGTKYVVQNQGYASVRIAVSAAAITEKTPDSLVLQTMTPQQGSHFQYTHATNKNVRLWAEGLSDGAHATVVFHAL